MDPNNSKVGVSEQAAARNKQITATGGQVYSWGIDTNRFDFGDNSGGLDYTVTFSLSKPPVASRLFLVVVGLAEKSTAEVSVAGELVGEILFPAGSTATQPSSVTTLDPAKKKLSSDGSGDKVNTGWALFQPTGAFTSLSVHLKQVQGDGVGWTLGYVCEDSLTVRKIVQGAPPGFTGTFAFLVECATPQGFVQKTVSVGWPTPSSLAVPGVPAGSTCTVTESQNFPGLPTGYAWSGTNYSPRNATVVTTAAGATVTATNTIRACKETCEVRIIKKLDGAPNGFSGVFTGVLRCWINKVLIDHPVTLSYPSAPEFTVPDLPQGISCTFKETVQPALVSPYQWGPPSYSHEFGHITLVDACHHELVVTNHARRCCNPPLQGTQ